MQSGIKDPYKRLSAEGILQKLEEQQCVPDKKVLKTSPSLSTSLHIYQSLEQVKVYLEFMWSLSPTGHMNQAHSYVL